MTFLQQLSLWLLCHVSVVATFQAEVRPIQSRPTFLNGPFSSIATTTRATIICRGGADDELPEGRTGWNHNPPDDTSSFWENTSPNGSPGSEESSTTNNNNNNNNNDNEPRTGWLHNTQPTPAAKEISKQQAQQTNKARFRLQQAMKEQAQNHRIISPPSFHACGKGRCMVVTEHMVSVPLDYSVARSPRIDLYFVIVEKVTDEDHRVWCQQLASLKDPKQRAQQYIQRMNLSNADDMILYLQGGPGFGSPTPMVGLGFSEGSSWAGEALNHYSKVVLMDQRGTGRSTTLTKQTLEAKFPDLFLLDQEPDAKLKSLSELAVSHPVDAAKVEQAVQEVTEYMSKFRADNIVRDAEEIKDALFVQTEEPVTEPRPWGAALGQSFGGFCMMSYLSLIDHPPRICLLTGGIAPMLTPIFDAYTALWGRVKERSLKYYQMYPGDIAVVKRIVQKLLQQPATLPSGGTLTARRFLQLGLALGGSPSAFASFHATLSTALVSNDDPQSDFSRAFLKYVDSAQSFDDHPIYFWMHETIYGDASTDNIPTNWAAHRAYEQLAANDQSYDYRHTSARMDDDSQPTLFFGEMVFPWMPEDFQELSGVGLQAVANALATKTDWGPLYDGAHMRKVLSDGTSRAAAAVYYDDMYVDFNASMKVASSGGPLEECKVWMNNDYQHSGLRDGGAAIFNKLYGMVKGEIRTPS